MSQNTYGRFAQQDVQQICAHFKTNERGLSSREAEECRQKYGLNEISESKITWLHIFVKQFKSSFIYLLIGAALLSFALKEFIDALMIVVFISINTTLGFLQEYKSEKALHLLKKFINVRAKVVRNGKEAIIDSRQIVPGDIVAIDAGDIIPADIRIIKDNDLIVDEEILSGESAPVRKNSSPPSAKKIAVHEAVNIGFSGTKVVEGSALGIVFATGEETAVGEIAILAGAKSKISNFEKGLTKLSKFTFLIVGLTLLFILGVNFFIKGRGLNIWEMAIFFIALAVSVIPEALPVVMSISLSKGAIKLAKKKVVVRRLSAIEDLGGIEILCTDKTGTLTKNKLAVAQIKSDNPETCLFYSVLASSFLNKGEKEPNNAFDIALWEKLAPEKRKQTKEIKKINELAFTPERRRNSVLIETKGERKLIVRGAAEEILPLAKNLTKEKKREIKDWLISEGKDGRRTLGIAYKNIDSRLEEYNQDEENNLNFVGAVSFADSLKETTQEAVLKAEKLGVQIKIITGDSAEVAASVGRQIGLIKSEAEVISGVQLARLNVKEQFKAVENYSVFARVSPQEKHKIIELLKKKFRVGYLGEGINDAPALSAANVSMVVESASDIARETADIVLLQKNLAVIIDGINEGRRIFANTIKYIKTTLASNFGNFYAIAIASFLIDYLPMLPLQILLLNLLSDFPMIAIATDNVEPADIKKPHCYEVKDMIIFCVALGLVSSLFDFIFFAIFSRISPSALQTNWFIGSILTELALIFSVRTRLPFYRAQNVSPYLFWLSVLAVIITVAAPFSNFGHNFFKFISPSLHHLWLILIIVAAYFIVTETAKLLYYHFFDHKNKLITIR